MRPRDADESSLSSAVAGEQAATQIVLSFDDNHLASALFGQYGQNLALIEKLDRLPQALGCAVLLGASRKSTLGLVTGKKIPAERLAATLAAHLYGVMRGAAIIRAHDIDEHVDALKIWAAIRRTA